MFTLRKNYNAYKDTRQQCSNYTVDFGEPISFFFYKGGGILCACDGLTKIHKSYGGGGVQLYIYVGPYEIRFNFSQILFFSFSFYGLLFNDQIKLYLSKSMSN